VVEPATMTGWDRDGIDVELPGLGPTRVGLRGRHQAANVAVADALLDALEEAGIATVKPDARRRGYATAVWPGRLELLDLGEGRSVLLDGAHNPAGAAALAQALDDLRPHLPAGPLTLVVASMADKDVDGVVTALGAADALRGVTVIATSVDAPRAMPAAELADRWRRIRGEPDVRIIPDALEAVDAAVAKSGTTVVAGSLYLVGAARAHLVDDPDLRDPDPGAPAR